MRCCGTACDERAGEVAGKASIDLNSEARRQLREMSCADPSGVRALGDASPI